METVTVRAAAEGSTTSSKASPMTAKAKVARKKPNASLVTPDRTNVRMTRGESCELASCRPTRVIAKTTPTNVSIDEDITPSMVSAVEVRTVLPRPQSGGSPTTSGCATTTAVRTPPRTSSRGMNQNRSRTHSDSRTRRCAQRDPTVNACIWPCWPGSRRRAKRSTDNPGLVLPARDGGSSRAAATSSPSMMRGGPGHVPDARHEGGVSVSTRSPSWSSHARPGRPRPSGRASRRRPRCRGSDVRPVRDSSSPSPAHA